MQKVFNVISTMSGTSLDGLDVVYSKIYQNNEKWEFSLIASKTVSYTAEWFKSLDNSRSLTGLELVKLDVDYGILNGEIINTFIAENKIDRSEVDFIASHGHTVFHQPKLKLTKQIGNGRAIQVTTGIHTINNFRERDVLLGGQGAPLVPIGDLLFFKTHKYCLNLGGIANISIKENDAIHAFDICPCNIPLNILAKMIGMDYDKNGELAQSGKLIPDLYSLLNDLKYYKTGYPKSLGIEWLEENILTAINEFKVKHTIPDILHTLTMHTAQQIANVIDDKEGVLVTGGGAFNIFLINLLKNKFMLNIVLPDQKIIEFKEAVTFGLLGVLRVLGENNCLKAVTGSLIDNCGGDVFLND